MELQGWQSLYLDALLKSQEERIAKFETVEYFTSVVQEDANGVQELLLHRTIARLDNHVDALGLLDTLCNSRWISYGPRVLAKIGDTEAILREQPEFSAHFETLRRRSGFTTYSLKDWRLIRDNSVVNFAKASVWAETSISIEDILPDLDLTDLSPEYLAAILEYLFENDIRIFQVGVLKLVPTDRGWAEGLHRILSAPYIEFVSTQQARDPFVLTSPAPNWSPHWKIDTRPTGVSRWRIVENHTGQELQGLGSTEIFERISVVLALSGLLREGIQLSPIDDDLIRPVDQIHPIWGFRRSEFSANTSTYQVHDIRALALGFLESMPLNHRVSIFRSRLAFHLVGRRWQQRSSASVVTREDGFYSKVVRAAELLGRNKFSELLAYIDVLQHRFEPVFRFFRKEATTALSLLERVDALPEVKEENTPESTEILCVAHASLPEQSGGYAIRAHGVLKALRNQHVDICAVTRPGFPYGVLTDASMVEVDGVPYERLPATSITRAHGEIQYLHSFIEPFKTLFQDRGVGIVHVRSTFLVALPALIAARELGLKVLYEVSGLWELVYQDREEPSHLLKRSSFAELAETITMNMADKLVVMNDAVRQIAVDRGVSTNRILIAHNAVNTEDFEAADVPQTQVFTLGYLGSFQDYEGLDDILEVAKLFRSKNIPLHVLMVGDGQQYARIRKRVVSEGLGHLITLTGRVPHQQVVTYYNQMDVLVYPRRSTGATETITPLKPFEALALAKPIVVSDVAPLQEIVGDNERGLLFESGNVESFARCIQDLYDNPDLKNQLGRAGREWVEEHRNWNNVAEVFMEAYRELSVGSGSAV